MSITAEVEQHIDEVVNLLLKSRSLLVITGAGLSADSGLPTYRGSGGLYKNDVDEQGISIEEILSLEGFCRDPSSVWRHIGQVENSCRNVQPNRGHYVIAAMEHRFERFWVLTQNVDGFHQRAGSRNVISIHGNIHNLRCTSCDYRTTIESYAGLDLVPHCPLCDRLIRPDVVLFGERLNQDAIKLYDHEMDQPFDIVFTVGTSSLFTYIRNPVIGAALLDRPTVEINPERTEVSDIVQFRLPLRAEQALDEIWSRFTGTKLL
jgi:NAD-dependent deacetylase